MYGSSWAEISTECYGSKIRANTLKNRFKCAAFQKFIAEEYGDSGAYQNIKEEEPQHLRQQQLRQKVKQLLEEQRQLDVLQKAKDDKKAVEKKAKDNKKTVEKKAKKEDDAKKLGID
jgi:hypothetical protein